MTGQDKGLANIRREIDAIDDGIVDLLVRRAEAQQKVKAQKAAAGSLAVSPLRPAREAEILRRIVKRGAGRLDAEFLVRLWRQILVASTLSQAKVTMHVARPVVASEKLFGLVAGHFGNMPLAVHSGETQVLAALAGAPGDLAVIETSGGWASGFAGGVAGAARILGLLPVLGGNGVPPLLLAGHAVTEPTGDDCTLLISRHSAEPGALWSVAGDGIFVSCVSGFVSDEALTSRSPGGVVAGRFPSQIKV